MARIAGRDGDDTSTSTHTGSARRAFQSSHAQLRANGFIVVVNRRTPKRDRDREAEVIHAPCVNFVANTIGSDAGHHKADNVNGELRRPCAPGRTGENAAACSSSDHARLRGVKGSKKTPTT